MQEQAASVMEVSNITQLKLVKNTTITTVDNSVHDLYCDTIVRIHHLHLQ